MLLATTFLTILNSPLMRTLASVSADDSHVRFSLLYRRTVRLLTPFSNNPCCHRKSVKRLRSLHLISHRSRMVLQTVWSEPEASTLTQYFMTCLIPSGSKGYNPRPGSDRCSSLFTRAEASLRPTPHHTAGFSCVVRCPSSLRGYLSPCSLSIPKPVTP